MAVDQHANAPRPPKTLLDPKKLQNYIMSYKYWTPEQRAAMKQGMRAGALQETPILQAPTLKETGRALGSGALGVAEGMTRAATLGLVRPQFKVGSVEGNDISAAGGEIAGNLLIAAGTLGIAPALQAGAAGAKIAEGANVAQRVAQGIGKLNGVRQVVNTGVAVEKGIQGLGAGGQILARMGQGAVGGAIYNAPYQAGLNKEETGSYTEGLGPRLVQTTPEAAAIGGLAGGLLSGGAMAVEAVMAEQQALRPLLARTTSQFQQSHANAWRQELTATREVAHEPLNMPAMLPDTEGIATPLAIGNQKPLGPPRPPVPPTPEMASLPAPAPGPLWRSAAREAVDTISQGKGEASQMLAMLSKQKGVKPDELRWTGVQAWLESKRGETVTKQQIADFLDDNAIEVEEVVLRPASQVAPDSLEWADIGTTGNRSRTAEGDYYIERTPDGYYALDSRSRAIGNYGSIEEAKAAAATHRRDWKRTIEPQTGAPGVERWGSRYTLSGKAEPEYRELVLWSKQAEPMTIGDEHYGNIATPDNPQAGKQQLGWVRFTEHVDESGRRVLHLEEVQSHRHQLGRAKGYTDEGGEAGRAPFEKTDQWASLGLKRAIRWAAEHGYERVTWTTGQQQVNRYGLLKESREIWLTQPDADGVSLLTIKDNLGGDMATDVPIRSIDELAEALGGNKNLAEQVYATEPTDVFGREGVRRVLTKDLRRGGEGVASFYDEMLPKIAEKYGKEYGGGKARQVAIDTGDGEMVDVWSMDIPVAMRDDVLSRGNALYANMPITPEQAKATRGGMARWFGNIHGRLYEQNSTVAVKAQRATVIEDYARRQLDIAMLEMTTRMTPEERLLMGELQHDIRIADEYVDWIQSHEGFPVPPKLKRSFEMSRMDAARKQAALENPRIQKAMEVYAKYNDMVLKERVKLGVEPKQTASGTFSHLAPVQEVDQLLASARKGHTVQVYDQAHFADQIRRQLAAKQITPEEAAVASVMAGISERPSLGAWQQMLKALPERDYARPSIARQRAIVPSYAQLESSGMAPAYDIDPGETLGRYFVTDFKNAAKADVLNVAREQGLVVDTIPGSTRPAQPYSPAMRRALNGRKAETVRLDEGGFTRDFEKEMRKAGSDNVDDFIFKLQTERSQLEAALERGFDGADPTMPTAAFRTYMAEHGYQSVDDAIRETQRRMDRITELIVNGKRPPREIITTPEIAQAFEDIHGANARSDDNLGLPSEITWKLVGAQLWANMQEFGSHLGRNIFDIATMAPIVSRQASGSQARMVLERALDAVIPGKLNRIAMVMNDFRYFKTPEGQQEFTQMADFLHQHGQMETMYHHAQKAAEGIEEVMNNLPLIGGGFKVFSAGRKWMFGDAIPKAKVAYALNLRRLDPSISDADLIRAVESFGQHAAKLQGTATRMAVKSGILPYGGFESTSIPAAVSHYAFGAQGTPTTSAATRIINLWKTWVAPAMLAAPIISKAFTGKYPWEVGLPSWNIVYRDKKGNHKGINLFALNPLQERVYKAIGGDKVTQAVYAMFGQAKAPEDVTGSVARGVTNLGLGVLGTNPYVRFTGIAAWGRAPYLLESGGLYAPGKDQNIGERTARAAAELIPLLDVAVLAAFPGLHGHGETDRTLGVKEYLGLPKEAGSGVGVLSSTGVPGLKLINENRFQHGRGGGGTGLNGLGGLGGGL